MTRSIDKARKARWDKHYADPAAWFWLKVDQSQGPDACWLWKRTRHQAGYGTLEFRRHKIYAHRFALILTLGEPPADKPYALHSCDNPPCCNPRHLRWGTIADNSADAVSRKRLWRMGATECLRGHPLTPDNIYTFHQRGKPYTVCRKCRKETSRKAALKHYHRWLSPAARAQANA